MTAPSGAPLARPHRVAAVSSRVRTFDSISQSRITSSREPPRVEMGRIAATGCSLRRDLLHEVEELPFLRPLEVDELPARRPALR